MSSALFPLLVAGAILVAILAMSAVVMLLVQGRSEAKIRKRLDPGASVGEEFGDVPDAPVLTTVARGGRVIEGWVDSDGESARLLLQVGWRNTEQRLLWYALQALLPVVLGLGVLAFWMFADVERKGLTLLMVAFSAVALSFLLPRWILRALAGSRLARIKSEIPLFIHLLVLLFEAGLSIRQALASIVREGSGVLPELEREFDLVIRQLDAGADIGEVLKNVGDMLGIPDLIAVLSVLRQIDRYGGEVREPLLEVLETIEERRSLDLRERVNLLSGRMTVVMVLFFFPALLIFVAGPAFLSIVQALGDVNAR